MEKKYKTPLTHNCYIISAVNLLPHFTKRLGKSKEILLKLFRNLFSLYCLGNLYQRVLKFDYFNV